MKKYKILLEYDGTRFSGWQMQQNAKSVQGLLLNAAKEIFKTERVEIMGSGRTDKGVHALGQVAHLNVDSKISPERIKFEFNDRMPYDINLIDVQQVNLKFHARHDAVSRTYLYQISNFRSAFLKPYIWWVKDTLNLKKMQEASKIFPGMHDFISFSRQESKDTSTKVLLQNLEIIQCDNLILCRIQASHFLWNMVRRLVGSIVEVGRGNLTVKDLERYLKTKSDEPSKFTAPPSGLFLEKIMYDKSEVPGPLVPATEKFLTSIR